MLYMSSKSDNDGRYTLTVTFAIGTDADMALVQVQVQNRVATALPNLPQEVQRQGVKTEKQSTNMLLIGNLIMGRLRTAWRSARPSP
jgi:hydrophobic/amphiphilic exporter-1 (mainly G- bacteria), HAE1 family